VGVLLGDSSSPIGGWEWREWERGSRAILQRLPRVSPLPCVSTSYKTKGIWEGEGDGRLGWPLGRFGNERRKKEEEKKKNGKLGRISFEFWKYWNLVQVVVMIG
jgi:hypothetical protein